MKNLLIIVFAFLSSYAFTQDIYKFHCDQIIIADNLSDSINVIDNADIDIIFMKEYVLITYNNTKRADIYTVVSNSEEEGESVWELEGTNLLFDAKVIKSQTAFRLFDRNNQSFYLFNNLNVQIYER